VFVFVVNFLQKRRDKNMQYPVIILQHKETGTFSIQSFDIPAGIAQGDTREEAKIELLSVLEDVLEFNHFEQGKPVPLPSACEDISLGDIQEYCPWVTLDGEAKDYLDSVELSTDIIEKILTHNRNIKN
jgi:predicted RNase H-like HicB family nuclease